MNHGKVSQERRYFVSFIRVSLLLPLNCLATVSYPVFVFFNLIMYLFIGLLMFLVFFPEVECLYTVLIHDNHDAIR